MSRTDTSTELFSDSPILPPDPVGDDGSPLEALHDREYRVRAYRKSANEVLIRGAVRDQKPPGLYLEGDTEPLTIHHMLIDLVVELPTMEITSASAELLTHPNTECTRIEQHYDGLVGLSIARGFTHKVRELFGGPRGCTHTTALVQAMAPVAMQCIWSMRAAAFREAGIVPDADDVHDDTWKINLNTCHVWAEDSDVVARIQDGEPMEPPVWITERMVELGMKPDDWRQRMRG